MTSKNLRKKRRTGITAPAKESQVTESECTLAAKPKITAKNNFSIVTATYNVARYLDDFFESLVNQSVSFIDSIEVILVDDGSTDETAAKIWEWVEKYPKNIKYFWQENAGQGAARNHGLLYAKNEWVTFIDPDDFISEGYFENANKIIEENKKDKPLKLVCASLVFYYEDKSKFSDTHPLRYRFAKGDIVLPVATPGKHINLNVTSNIFKRNRILEQKIEFRHDIKPGFEDSHFINSYLLTIEDGHMAYLQSAQYFYRKRDDGTSTLDTGWQHPGRYDHQLRLGSLGLIQKSLDTHGIVLEYIQRVALYDLSWHFNKIIKKDADIYSLEPDKLEKYKSLVKEILGHISKETIMSFELAGFWFYHKLGLLSLFKDYTPDFNIAYIDEIDTLKDLVKIRYFSTSNKVSEWFAWDGKGAIPVYSKTRNHDFFGECFINERIVWLRIGDTKKLTMGTCNKPTRISLKGKQYREGVFTQDIYDAFKATKIDDSLFDEDIIRLRELARAPHTISKFGNCWVFMDRDNFADDNAEHLYRHTKKFLPRQKIFFVLDEASTDWNRLNDEGFNLVQLSSDDHKLALLNAEHFISSHADQYIFADIDKKHYGDLLSYKFTFLQHGVISCDLSHWLNTKNIDCFITSTPQEYSSIQENGPYKFTRKEVVLTGLPRLDRLFSLEKSETPSILIMPTWRSSIVGKLTGNGNEREYNPEFVSSEFFKNWSNALNSDALKKLSSKFEIIFYPHANIVDYISDFDLPDFIKVKSQSDASIQNELAKAEILLTDYSSVAFDFAYLDKIVYYFQFDAEAVLSGGHTYRPGYFDYAKDGFGPISKNLQSLEENLIDFYNNNQNNNQHYLERIKNTFPSEKGNTCANVITAIQNLSKATIPEKDTIDSLKQYTENPHKEDDNSCLIAALTQLHDKAINVDECAISLAKAYREIGCFDKSLEWLSKAPTDNSATLIERLELAIAKNETTTLEEQQFELDAHNIKNVSDEHFALLLKYHTKKNNLQQVDLLLSEASSRNTASFERTYAEGAILLKLWDTALTSLLCLKASAPDDIQISAMLAQAYYNLEHYDEAWKLASTIPTSKIPANCALIFGRLAFSNNNWKYTEACLSPLTVAGGLHGDDYLKLAKSQRKLNKLTLSETSLSMAVLATDQRTLLQEKALILSATRQWQAAVEAWEIFLSRKDLSPNRDGLLHLAACRIELGQLKESKRDITRFEKMAGPNDQSRELRKQLASI